MESGADVFEVRPSPGGQGGDIGSSDGDSEESDSEESDSDGAHEDAEMDVSRASESGAS